MFKTNMDVRDWLQEALRGYYKLGENPQDVQIANINSKTGLEVFVKGKLPGVSRNLIGFVDRVSSSSNGGVVVEDWKTGGKLKQWEGGYPELVKNKDGSTSYNTREAAGYAEARQQMIYTTLLRQNGYQVDGARLMFPVAGGIAQVPVDDSKFQEAVVADVVEIDQKMDELEESNEFSYNHLCYVRGARWLSSARQRAHRIMISRSQRGMNNLILISLTALFCSRHKLWCL